MDRRRRWIPQWLLMVALFVIMPLCLIGDAAIDAYQDWRERRRRKRIPMKDHPTGKNEQS